MNALAMRTATAVLVGLLLFGIPGCRSKPEPKPAAKDAASADASGAPSAETSSSAPATASGVVTPPTGTPTATAAPATAPVPPKPAPVASVTLGPKNAPVSWAYLKDMYVKNGTWYVVVDYIQVVGPEETIHFVNENPLLRTFPLSSKAKLMLLTGSGGPDYKSVSPAKFKAFQAKSGAEVVEVTPKAGYAIQLKEWWAP